MFGLPTQDEPEQDEEESDEDIKTSFDKLPPNTTSKERWYVAHIRLTLASARELVDRR